MDIDDLSTRYAKIPVAVISDILRFAGTPNQVLTHKIAALDRYPAFAGPAFCVAGESLLGGALKAADDRRFEMYERVFPGAVLVLASGNYKQAVVFGGNVALSLKARGCKAIVTDGGVRDRDAFSQMGLPVCARFITPVSSGKQWITTQIDRSVYMPGQTGAMVEIQPGDMVVSDSDGTIIIPQKGLLSVLEDAEKLVEIEQKNSNPVNSRGVAKDSLRSLRSIQACACNLKPSTSDDENIAA